VNNKENAQATINLINTYEPRLQVSFNLLLIINYRFIINKLLQLTNCNNFTI